MCKFYVSVNEKTLYRVIFNEDLEKIISMEPIYIGERNKRHRI